MKPIIRVEHLGKQYRIGAPQKRHDTMRDLVASAIREPLSRLRADDGSKEDETIWALKDVSFTVQPGEVVGIIGRNGAGKSTLLKILSRITDPTVGEAELYGRVASLLEVGTGFHGELTGRENIFLNGAMLGMKRAEIQRKFDEIVAFAEVEKFIDTPVKHYSSGMYTRLAFSVAAHLEPEIFIIDEVLAVGDAPFQQKCLGKIEEVGAQGRTVFFVSHNIPMISRLCTRAFLLDRGKLTEDGAPQTVTSSYLRSDSNSQAQRIWDDPRTVPGDAVARLHSVSVLDEGGRPASVIDIRRPFFVELKYWNLQTKIRPTSVVHFVNEEGITLFATNEFNNPSWHSRQLVPGLVTTICCIPGNFLAEGFIYVLAAVTSYNPDAIHAIERNAVAFQIVDKSEGDGVRGIYSGKWPGVLRPMIEWKVKYD